MSETLPLHYVEQGAADLAFYLFESPAPRECVQVLAERRLEIRGAAITLAIIGSSHFLEIAARDGALCEMLACPRPGLEQIPRVSEAAGQRYWRHQRERGGLSYRFELTSRRCSQEEFERVTRKLATPAPDRLHYLFPKADEAGSALTCLRWQLSEGTAEIATFHTYPGELALVETHSVIDVAEAGARP